MKAGLITERTFLLLKRLHRTHETHESCAHICLIGETALCTAARLGHLENVRTLLSHPTVDANVQDEEGNVFVMKTCSGCFAKKDYFYGF